MRLFQAGFVAACLQLVAVALVTPFVFAIMRHRSITFMLMHFKSNAEVPSSDTQSSILIGTYLIISFGIALTENRFTDLTAMQIRHVSHLRKYSRPNLTMVLLLILLWLGAAGFAVVALQTPQQFLVDLGHHFGWGDAFIIIWPGTMSIGTACFGANAHATMKALQW